MNINRVIHENPNFFCSIFTVIYHKRHITEKQFQKIPRVLIKPRVKSVFIAQKILWRKVVKWVSLERNMLWSFSKTELIIFDVILTWKQILIYTIV